MRPIILCLVILVILVVAPTPRSLAQPGLVSAGLHPVPLTPAVLRVLDLTGDGKDELLIIDSEGRVLTFPLEGVPGEGRGELVLPHPDATLVTLADILATGGPPQLVAVSPSGLFAYSVGEGGTFVGPGHPLTSTRGRVRARFDMRTGVPTWCDLCQDVNGDGNLDVVLPDGEFCELWLHRGAQDNGGAESDREDAAPRLQRTARLAVQVSRELQYGGHLLSDNFESTFVIPRLQVEDVNGDGRQDVLVADGRDHAWHLQQADGTIPAEPTHTLDLRIFKDTTPEATMRPGRTLAGGDRQRYISRDLNKDGIPDAVIAHRRKVWAFFGNQSGPQFTRPAQVLKTADDVTAMLLLNLDGDGYPDLVILKILVPSVGTLIFSALGDLEVELSAVGYRNDNGLGFETKPTWKSDLVVKLPSVASILKNPYAIIRRFEDASGDLATVTEVDLDGDGKPEVLQPDASHQNLEIWFGKNNPSAVEAADTDGILRRILFEDANKEWNIDRLVEWVGRLSQSDRVRRTGPRPPDLVYPLRPLTDGAFRELHVQRLGEGKAGGLVLAYETAAGKLALDRLTWRP